MDLTAEMNYYPESDQLEFLLYDSAYGEGDDCLMSVMNVEGVNGRRGSVEVYRDGSGGVRSFVALDANKVFKWSEAFAADKELVFMTPDVEPFWKTRLASFRDGCIEATWDERSNLIGLRVSPDLGYLEAYA